MTGPTKANPKLTKDQQRVMFGKATEAPFTGKFLHHKANGTYTCANCGAQLFDSQTKFDSGTGWPSFYDVANSKAVKLKEDLTQDMHRVEVNCANCGAHLGHVFNDAPDQPTGVRFCINSCSLDFQPQNKK